MSDLPCNHSTEPRHCTGRTYLSGYFICKILSLLFSVESQHCCSFVRNNSKLFGNPESPALAASQAGFIPTRQYKRVRLWLVSLPLTPRLSRTEGKICLMTSACQRIMPHSQERMACLRHSIGAMPASFFRALIVLPSRQVKR